MQNTQIQHSPHINQQQISADQPQTYVYVQEVVSMPKAEYLNMKDKIAMYEIESSKLHIMITNNELVIKKLETINNGYCEKIAQLEKENNLLREKVRKLTSENNNLRNRLQKMELRVREQENTITQLQNDVTNQKNTITQLQNDVIELKNRDDPITIREAFTALERYILYDITTRVTSSTGSKTKARKYYGTQDLLKDNTYTTRLDTFMKKHNITEDHLYFIANLKDTGNSSAHSNRPCLDRADWEKFTLSALQKPDCDDIKMVNDLLNLLEYFNPVSGSGQWVIDKPY